MKSHGVNVAWEVEQDSASQTMSTFMDAGGVHRLEEYFRKIGDILGEESRRGSFAIYAMGLLGEGERKSLEPIAARACPDPKKTDAMHQTVTKPGHRCRIVLGVSSESRMDI
jgi:hypothetical protein